MNIASLFNLAGPDLIIILLIVLLLFGARKLPELAEHMRQALREFTKAKDEFEREVTGASDLPAHERHPLKALLTRLHGGYAAAAVAPFPLSP
jgi:sec-independent protein translocase protein TatA